LRAFKNVGIWSSTVVLVGAVATACGGGGDTSSTSSTTTNTQTSVTTGSGGGGTGGTGGTTTTSSTGGGGTGGTGGTAGTPGPGASQLVNAGSSVQSANYRMVFTLGQPTQNQTKTTSPGYRMQGGLIGAVGTTP
jgi:hypothetical protein